MKSFKEVEQAIINFLKAPSIPLSREERKKQLKKQKELMEEQEKRYKTNREQFQKQFRIKIKVEKCFLRQVLKLLLF